MRQGWNGFVSGEPITLYAPEDLMPRTAEITFETGVIVYDALFIALAENTDTVVITADSKLLKTLSETVYARFAHPLAEFSNLIP